ncbi:hypothetical protein MTR67_019542 [Solanum verrucosum]|uniref:Ethylene insensitive 3-like DNA-binding domain-containing protein n=1 Tax=Solanum verrucosum TaxID=315347 RepID=A0AAF0QLQ2_SOLVR|nr:hypothetical protein MTR67_019542 [Solanum verrucosum]
MVEFEEIMEPSSPINSEENEEIEDEEINYDDLKRRMWKDRMRMQILKRDMISEELSLDEESEAKQEQSRRKKMSRAQDSVLKYMVKIMEICKGQGFVYGIVPEKGKPVTGSSDSLRDWWKEKVRFEKNAPNAIATFLPKLVLENHVLLDPNSCMNLLNDLMTAKETATWSKVVNQEEVLVEMTEKSLRISISISCFEEKREKEGCV